MPSASVARATAVKDGRASRCRKASRRSSMARSYSGRAASDERRDDLARPGSAEFAAAGLGSEPQQRDDADAAGDDAPEHRRLQLRAAVLQASDQVRRERANADTNVIRKSGADAAHLGRETPRQVAWQDAPRAGRVTGDQPRAEQQHFPRLGKQIQKGRQDAGDHADGGGAAAAAPLFREPAKRDRADHAAGIQEQEKL